MRSGESGLKQCKKCVKIKKYINIWGAIQMSLNLIYITNQPEIALIAERNGVQRIMVDMETLGKEERQKNMNTVKSHHTVEDVAAIAKALTKSELLVRINPWHEGSVHEIESVIKAGADSIMLPMWKTPDEVDAFLRAVNKRVGTTLLLETREAAECLDAVLENPLLNHIHIGLNDLHLSYGMTFMFEPLANGMVEKLCVKCKAKGVAYGFGGIARLGQGLVPAERVIMEHYRLGSTGVILSRSFCNADEAESLEEIRDIFSSQMKLVREFEASLADKTPADYAENQQITAGAVAEVVQLIRKKRSL